MLDSVRSIFTRPCIAIRTFGFTTYHTLWYAKTNSGAEIETLSLQLTASDKHENVVRLSETQLVI